MRHASLRFQRRQRGALADAVLAAGATILLLLSTSAAAGRGVLVLGIALVVAGIGLLWGTPRPVLAARLLASVAGLLMGFGIAVGGAGRWVALAAGAVLLLAVLRVSGGRLVARRVRRS
jgi:hypothetical protein